ncbi:MAG: exo-alpha-sialidase [Bryobacterales bacterium]|nr:exo-alpha-sialidase [Bryobacterales bacterium]
MVRRTFLTLATGVAACGPLAVRSARAAASPQVLRHVDVCRREGRYGGWPANHGAWIWGNEILVGFELGWFQAKRGDGHAIDWDRPAEHLLARSLDGGETWRVEQNDGLRPPPDERVAGVPVEPGGKPLTDCPGGIDFTSAGFALTARMNSVDAGQSRFYYTLDRGKQWEGPFRIPDFGQPGTAARTDYLVNGPHDLTMFLTAAKRNGKEGRIIAVRTEDGAKTWRMLSFVCPEPAGDDYAIMPSSVRLPGGAILTAIRYQKWIDLYRSEDNAKTWRYIGRPAPKTGGNPPSMVLLADGRIALTYGYRRKPYGIRARLSSDEGATWGKEIILRQDGGNSDLGYPRTVQRPDGVLVTMYYYNTDRLAERFIGATLWTPGA